MGAGMFKKDGSRHYH